MKTLTKIEIVDNFIYYIPYVFLRIVHSDWQTVNFYVKYSVLYILILNNIMAAVRLIRLRLLKKKTEKLLGAIIANLIIGLGLAIIGPI